MPRFDKVEPKGGSFRAPLNYAVASGEVGVVFGIGLDVNGRVVKGAGQTGVVALICPSNVMSAGDPIDCMTDGEIADMTGLAAGTAYYVNSATGALESTAPAAGTNKVKAGHTVQSWRLVVRVRDFQG
jgi:hypothetical protein